MLTNLIDQDLLDDKVFSLYYNSKAKKSQSQIIFGGWHEDTKDEDIKWYDVKSDTYWAIELDHVSVSDQILCSEGCLVVIDSGTSLITAPQKDYDKLADFFDSYTADCKNLSTFPSLK